MTSLADILRRYWPAYVDQFGARNILPSHHAAVNAILACHTPVCGGSLYHCDCGHQHFTYHGCGHRACPQCGQRQSQQWADKQTHRLLPVTYYLMTFTVPEQLRMLIRSHQRRLLKMLFDESAATLQDIASTPKHLGAELGFLGALHTWSRQIIYHPHIHYLVPGIGITPDGGYKLPKQKDFLLHVKVLSRRFRTRMRQALQQDMALYTQIPSSTWKKEWVVHCKSVGKGDKAVQYLSRYIYHTAISSQRHLHEHQGIVTFNYRDSETSEQHTAHLPVFKFIARFLQHVLPKRFRRIRSYGFLSPAAKKKFTRLCTLLDALPATQPFIPTPIDTPVICPHCKQSMRLVGTFGRAPP